MPKPLSANALAVRRGTGDHARAHARRRPQDRASRYSGAAAAGGGEVQIRIKAIGLNHIDVWGWRGMAFAKRKLPLIVGVEAAGEIAARRPGRQRRSRPATASSPMAALTCGTCKACREGRDNLCENVAGIMGFHVDGFARDLSTCRRGWSSRSRRV